jgi:hypothetical protein
MGFFSSKILCHLNQPVSNGVCQEFVDLAYQCMAKEVYKTPIAKNSAIIMATGKQFLIDYLLKTFTPKKKHLFQGASLDVIMDKFATLVLSKVRNFWARLKRLVQSSMETMENIMELNDHSWFKFVHNNYFSMQSKDQVFVFKMSMDLLGSGVNLIKQMQAGRDMENLWVIFDHMKRVKE